MRPRTEEADEREALYRLARDKSDQEQDFRGARGETEMVWLSLRFGKAEGWGLVTRSQAELETETRGMELSSGSIGVCGSSLRR